MSGGSRFRLFGRSGTPADPPPPPRVAVPPRGGAPAPWGPSPALFGGSVPPSRQAGDPDTDPHGFTPVAPSGRPVTFPQFPSAEPPPSRRFPHVPTTEPEDPMDAPTAVTTRAAATPLLPRAVGDATAMPRFPVPSAATAAVVPLFGAEDGAAAPAATAERPHLPNHSEPPAVPFDTSPDPAPDPAEAASLAAAFAADYLSWDEDDPARRGRVLVDYLASPGTDPTHLGWPGSGRQRAEFAVPGRVRADGDGRTLVDVRVRVTPYRRTAAAPAATTPEWAEAPETAGIPAVAPAPHAVGWAALGSYWIRLSVPIVRAGGRLAIDAWEENLGEELEEPRPNRTEVADTVDPSLADDAVELPRGGAR